MASYVSNDWQALVYAQSAFTDDRISLCKNKTNENNIRPMHC